MKKVCSQPNWKTQIGDMVSEMKKYIIKLEIASSFEEVKMIKKTRYDKIVREKVIAEAFKYL